jgi:hypothetical protein
MWATWFATFNLTCNGCVCVGTGPRRIKYYHFELPKSNEENNPFTGGMIDITRPADFPDKRLFPLLDYFNAEIEEWGSINPVTPIACIKVKSEDFPDCNRVQFSL